MTTLSFEKYNMPGADLGATNCLPDILNDQYIHAKITITDKVKPEERKWINKGMIPTLLPYQIQDGYNRDRVMHGYDAAVLENEFIRAVFLPELGGRLWSLIDKRTNRELLYCNTVFQPANLALRNAWFSGGVEWNLGIKGHNPLTCSPMFARACKNSNGDPVLKMYEFERIRGVAYTIYATLHNDVLLTHVTIENTEDCDKYMYWWSNIAVDETPKSRVIVPANESFYCSYEEGGYVLNSGEIPMVDDIDITYSTNINRSRDFFFKIPEDHCKWVAAVKEDGAGLIQFSDPTLKGRKMFLWGQQQGGAHWNEWLSDRPKPYIEIQAGILKTQLEHFIMPKNSTLSWTEGYALVEGNPEVLHGADYTAAANEIERVFGDRMQYVYEDKFTIMSEEPLMYKGSGWGALENRIRKAPISTVSDFCDCSLNDEQYDWIQLLETGRLPEHDIQAPIRSYVKGKFWLDLLEKNIHGTWYEYNQLGVLYYTEGNTDKAEECFLKSVEIAENPWSLRNLAQIEKNVKKNTAAAADLMLRAVAIKADYVPLLVDCAAALIADGRYAKWEELYNTLTPELRAHGRLCMLRGICAIRMKNIPLSLEILNENLVVCDMREGEYALSAMWQELYTLILAEKTGRPVESITKEEVFAAYPLPYSLDFRMH